MTKTLPVFACLKPILAKQRVGLCHDVREKLMEQCLAVEIVLDIVIPVQVMKATLEVAVPSSVVAEN